jgi:hypothetical protein
VLGNGSAQFSGNKGVILQEPDRADKKIIQVNGSSAFQMLFVRNVGSSDHGLAICVRAIHKGLLKKAYLVEEGWHLRWSQPQIRGLHSLSEEAKSLVFAKNFFPALNTGLVRAPHPRGHSGDP